MTYITGLILGLLAAGTARADSIYSPSLLITSTDSVSSISGLAASSFGAGDGVYSQYDLQQQQLFQQWSNAQNLGISSSLLTLMLSLGGGNNPLMSQLYAPGAVFATPQVPISTAVLPLTADAAPISTQIQVEGSAPEPASMSLLAAATMLLMAWALARIRKIRESGITEA